MIKSILSIGDVHGLSNWKDFIFGGGYEKWRSDQDHSVIKHDKIIFIGDYFDSFTVPNAEMKHNIMEIIHLKETLGDRVVLLLGNHDIHYIDKKYRCSGIRPEMWFDFNEIMRMNSHLFQAAYQYKDILWSHAGLTRGSWEIYKRFLDEEGIKYEDYADALNILYKMNYEPIFYAGYGRGGSSRNPGIFWADKRELINDPEVVSQVVGHTPVSDIEIHVAGTYRSDNGNQVVSHLAFIDCVERGSKSPYTIEFNGKSQMRSLKKMKYDK